MTPQPPILHFGGFFRILMAHGLSMFQLIQNNAQPPIVDFGDFSRYCHHIQLSCITYDLIDTK